MHKQNNFPDLNDNVEKVVIAESEDLSNDHRNEGLFGPTDYGVQEQYWEEYFSTSKDEYQDREQLTPLKDEENDVPPKKSQNEYDPFHSKSQELSIFPTQKEEKAALDLNLKQKGGITQFHLFGAPSKPGPVSPEPASKEQKTQLTSSPAPSFGAAGGAN